MHVGKIEATQGVGRLILLKKWITIYLAPILIFGGHAIAGSEDAVLLNHFLNGISGSQSQQGIIYGSEDAVLLDYFLNDRGVNKNKNPSYPQASGVSSWPIKAKYVGMSDLTPIYISTEGLTRQQNGDILFWMLRSWDEIKKTGDIPFLSNSTMLQLDCKSKTVKTVANMYWSGAFLRGKLVKEDLVEGKKFNIASSQVGLTILDNLCN